MGCSPIASRYRKTHQEALRYLLDELRADIALVQEALLAPATLASPGYLFKSPSLVGHDAGSAVLASGIAARELSLRADGCCIAAAELERPSGTFVAVSVHVSTLRTQKRFLRSLIDSLMPVLAGKRFVVGGDFTPQGNIAKVLTDGSSTIWHHEVSMTAIGPSIGVKSQASGAIKLPRRASRTTISSSTQHRPPRSSHARSWTTTRYVA
jgi:endonuclease/exonuclease/phosphatase family metal-dependent hydrolase